MYRLVVGMLLGMMLIAAGALAENTTVDGATTTPPDGSSNAPPMDFDQDGVIDDRDVCPNTPAGAIIVDPFAHPDYAGCNCLQVRALINTTNPCIDLYCYQELLEIDYAAVPSTFIDCPEDYCEGFTYHDYSKDGYTSCVDGKLREHVCSENIYPEATVCGWEPPLPEQNTTINGTAGNDATPSADNTTDDISPVATDEPATTGSSTSSTEPRANNTIPTTATVSAPRPEGNAAAPREEERATVSNTYYLSDATVNYTHQQDLREGEDATLKLQFTTNRTGLGLDPVLTTADGNTLLMRDVNCTSINETYMCTGTWDLPTDRERDEDLNLAITYTTPDGTIYENIKVPIRVREKAFEALPAEVAIVRNLKEPREEILIRAVYEEYAEQERPIIKDADEFVAKVAETAKHVDTEKRTDYDQGRNTTRVSISIRPNPGIVAKNITIIEYIPKDVAQSVADLEFSDLPPGVEFTVLNDDPLVMWHFAAVDERIDLSYEVKGELAATANTIVVANELENEQSPWFIIIPMLMIPLLVILLIVVPRMLTHHHEE